MNYNTWAIEGNSMGNKPVSSIAHPSQKVILHETHGRHFGKRQVYFAVSTGESRVPLLVADGSADVRATSHANIGWSPSSPSSPSLVAFYYSPIDAGATWDPPIVHPTKLKDDCYGFYRFTRSATKGRDFGGPEVPYQ